MGSLNDPIGPQNWFLISSHPSRVSICWRFSFRGFRVTIPPRSIGQFYQINFLCWPRQVWIDYRCSHLGPGGSYCRSSLYPQLFIFSPCMFRAVIVDRVEALVGSASIPINYFLAPNAFGSVVARRGVVRGRHRRRSSFLPRWYPALNSARPSLLVLRILTPFSSFPCFSSYGAYCSGCHLHSRCQGCASAIRYCVNDREAPEKFCSHTNMRNVFGTSGPTKWWYNKKIWRCLSQNGSPYLGGSYTCPELLRCIALRKTNLGKGLGMISCYRIHHIGEVLLPHKYEKRLLGRATPNISSRYHVLLSARSDTLHRSHSAFCICFAPI